MQMRAGLVPAADRAGLVPAAQRAGLRLCAEAGRLEPSQGGVKPAHSSPLFPRQTLWPFLLGPSTVLPWSFRSRSPPIPQYIRCNVCRPSRCPPSHPLPPHLPTDPDIVIATVLLPTCSLHLTLRPRLHNPHPPTQNPHLPSITSAGRSAALGRRLLCSTNTPTCGSAHGVSAACAALRSASTRACSSAMNAESVERVLSTTSTARMCLPLSVPPVHASAWGLYG
mmetsp:Transcript_6379/g.19798  ORF Transcript_6379/g.19798 Transcript_6379/m.19798 type:complete len:225 (-) Transcript_6379:571-1245(-)